MRRYGVFKLGQIWSVTGDDGSMIGFSTWPGALMAVATLLEEMRSQGRTAEVILQDQAGRLITTDRPMHFMHVRGLPHDTVWDRVSPPGLGEPGPG